MEDNTQAQTCINCSTKLNGPICHNCGQKQMAQRWTMSILWTQFINQLTNIEKGFFYTIKSLFTSPGSVLHDYWNGKTIPYYNPFRFAIILTAISIFLSYWLGIDEMLQSQMDQAGTTPAITDETMASAERHFDNWFNFLVLLLIPFNSFITWLLFYRKKKNYSEHFIMISFVMGQGAFYSSFTSLIFYLIPALFPFYVPFNFLISWIYNSYVFQKTFKNKLWLTIIKAFVVGTLGVIVFFILINILNSIAIGMAG